METEKRQLVSQPQHLVGDDRERAVADHGFSAQHIITLAEKPEQELHQPQIVSQLLVEFGFLELMFLYLHSLSF